MSALVTRFQCYLETAILKGESSSVIGSSCAAAIRVGRAFISVVPLGPQTVPRRRSCPFRGALTDSERDMAIVRMKKLLVVKADVRLDSLCFIFGR